LLSHSEWSLLSKMSATDQEKQPLLPSADGIKEEEVDARPPSEENKEKEYFVFPKNENIVVTYLMTPIRFFTSGRFEKKMKSSSFQSGWKYLLIGGNFSKRRTVRFHWRFAVFWIVIATIGVIIHWSLLREGAREWKYPIRKRH
ncbi:hypothetical protein PRIPAC_74076, partial [Pristionchus pacificus]